MKNLFKTTAILLALTLGNVSCEKEDEQIQVSEQTQDFDYAKQKLNILKSENSYLKEMAQAANVKKIDFEDGIYEVSFYGAISDCQIEVLSFDPEGLIEYKIIFNNNSIYVEIDNIYETIDIENDDVYTFDEYKDFNVTSSEDVIRNVVTVITGHHSFEADVSANYSDNGSEDVAPSKDPDTNARRKFIGTIHHPCVEGFSRGSSTYFFWIRVGKGPEHPC